MNTTATEVINRAIKYLVEGLAIAAVAIFIPKKSLPIKDVVALGDLVSVLT